MFWEKEVERVEKELGRTIRGYEKALKLMEENKYVDSSLCLIEALLPQTDELQYNWGVIYLHGKNGVEKNAEKAVAWFLKAAAQENRKAEYALGCVHFRGLIQNATKKEAIDWWEKALEHGENNANIDLGCAYICGDGVRQDLDIGIRYLLHATEYSTKNRLKETLDYFYKQNNPILNQKIAEAFPQFYEC